MQDSAGGRIHPRDGKRLRHLRRAGRDERLRRAEAEDLHRPRAAQEAGDTNSRRLDERRRHYHRRHDPQGVQGGSAGDDDTDNLAENSICGRRRQDRRTERRPDRRSRDFGRAPRLERDL